MGNELSKNTDELADLIVSANTQEDFDELVSLFNFNQRKKNIIRTAKLDDLMDNITDRMLTHLQSGMVASELLPTYLVAAMKARDKSSKIASDISDVPTIVKNTQVNVTVQGEELDRDSRDRVADAVRKIMANSNTVTEQDIVDVENVKVLNDVTEDSEE